MSTKGTNLRKMREDAALSRYVVALGAGTTLKRLRNIEAGRSEPTNAEAAAITKAIVDAAQHRGDPDVA